MLKEGIGYGIPATSALTQRMKRAISEEDSNQYHLLKKRNEKEAWRLQWANKQLATVQEQKIAEGHGVSRTRRRGVT